MLETFVVDLLAGYDAGGVVGEEVHEATAEEVNGAGSQAYAVQRRRFVEVDVGRCEEGGEAIVE